MEKSANKKWKESGSSLSFKEWIERENRKKESEGNFIPFSANPNIQSVIDTTLNRSKEEIQKTAGYKTPENVDKSKILGLDKRILFFSSVLIIGSVGYYFYKKMKSK